MKQQIYILRDIQTENSKSKLNILIEVFTELFLLGGFTGVLTCFISDKTAQTIMFSIMFATVILINVLKIIGRGAAFVGNIVPVIGIMLLVVQPQGAGRGALYLLNQLITLWNTHFNDTVMRFTMENPTIFNRLQILLFIILIISWLICKWVNAKNNIAITIGMMITFLVVSILAIGVNAAVVVVWLIGWFSAWTYSMSEQQKMAKCVGVMAAILALSIICILVFRNYTADIAIDKLEQSVAAEIEKFRYGSDNLPEGDMTKAYEMSSGSGEDALIITFDKAQKVYLRGFVGAIFNGKMWCNLDYTEFTDADLAMINWLNGQSMNIPSQYSEAQNYLVNGNNVDFGNVTIENVGANRKYMYLPYTFSDILSGNGNFNRDYQMESGGLFGSRRYTFSMLYNNFATEQIKSNDIDYSVSGADEYNQKERVYKTYVSEKYMDVPEKYKDTIQNKFFDEGVGDTDSLYQITNKIRIALQTLSGYSVNADAYSGEYDFLDWFINLESKGNASYFATVATLAYRQAGYPARYVEGYYLSDTTANKLNNSGETQVTLKDTDIHAWVEVYVDGYGWLPVEVVPGFYSAEYTTQTVLGAPQSSVNIKNDTTEDTFEGSSTDTIDSVGDDGSDKVKDKTPTENILQVVGIMLLVFVTIWLIQLLLILRYRIVKHNYDKKLEAANTQDGSRMLYHHACQVLVYAGINVKEDYPYDNVSEIIGKVPDVKQFQCERVIQLIQKVVFGEMDLTKAEYMTVKNFDDKVTEKVYENADMKTRVKIKYLKVLV